MAVAIIMPRQGNTVESCIITKWNKRKGDAVAPGDILFSYETDKAAFDEEAKVAGTLIDIFFEEGDDVPVLTNVCVIGEPGESTAEFAPEGAASEAQEVAETPAVEAAAPVAVAQIETEAAAPAGDIKISPRAKALAEARGADLSYVRPTGPDGRVIERDVQALIDAGKLVSKAASASYAGGAVGTGLGGRVTLADLEKAPAAPAISTARIGALADDSYTEPMSNMRKIIGKSMTTSLATTAQLTHSLTFDATDIQNMRKLFKEKGEARGMHKITLNDIVMYAVVRTLQLPAHRALNAHLIDDGKTMRYFRGVHLGFACDTERGLMVPTLFDADKMTLKELSDSTKALAQSCRDGKISPDLLQGASFTVSNLGALGIESFTPVINPPQTGILGVCTITTGVREVAGALQAYPAMGLSLTYDHRAMDGMPASKFLADLKSNLENFTLLIAQG
ncbi:MAG: dihydrolipoamide acetyltransferase family protein [Christensenellales bacterium]|jgi:pyruvate dehydrogenase E2 component (dihydrolipoamide acetyltransferase)